MRVAAIFTQKKKEKEKKKFKPADNNCACAIKAFKKRRD